MKFKAEITLEGMNALEKQFLPTMEKFGKTCYLFLTPTDVHLIQDQDNADGTQTSARLDNGYVFDTTSLVCQSLADNHIAFTITIATLLKVLRVARGHGAGSLRVKLTTRRAPSTNPEEDGDSSVLCPMLVLFPQVEGLDISQEMPVGKPVGHDLLLRLRDLRSVGTICTFYLDIYPVLVHLTAIADRLKPLSETVSFSLTRQGDLHLNVEGTGVLLGEGVPGLEVLPHEEAEKAMELQATRLEARLREARLHRDDAATALLHLSHVIKVLHSAPMTQPQRVLVGIEKCYVHVLFVYPAMSEEQMNDDTLQLFYKLPILEE